MTEVPHQCASLPSSGEHVMGEFLELDTGSSGSYDRRIIRGDHLHIMGSYNIIYGTRCRVLGDHNKVYVDYAQVTGNANTLYGKFAMAIGDKNSVFGLEASAVGSSNLVNGRIPRAHAVVENAELRAQGGVISRGGRTLATYDPLQDAAVVLRWNCAFLDKKVLYAPWKGKWHSVQNGSGPGAPVFVEDLAEGLFEVSGSRIRRKSRPSPDLEIPYDNLGLPLLLREGAITQGRQVLWMIGDDAHPWNQSPPSPDQSTPTVALQQPQAADPMQNILETLTRPRTVPPALSFPGSLLSCPSRRLAMDGRIEAAMASVSDIGQPPSAGTSSSSSSSSSRAPCIPDEPLAQARIIPEPMMLRSHSVSSRGARRHHTQPATESSRGTRGAPTRVLPVPSPRTRGHHPYTRTPPGSSRGTPYTPYRGIRRPATVSPEATMSVEERPAGPHHEARPGSVFTSTRRPATMSAEAKRAGVPSQTVPHREVRSGCVFSGHRLYYSPFGGEWTDCEAMGDAGPLVLYERPTAALIRARDDGTIWYQGRGVGRYNLHGGAVCVRHGRVMQDYQQIFSIQQPIVREYASELGDVRCQDPGDLKAHATPSLFVDMHGGIYDEGHPVGPLVDPDAVLINANRSVEVLGGIIYQSGQTISDVATAFGSPRPCAPIRAPSRRHADARPHPRRRRHAAAESSSSSSSVTQTEEEEEDEAAEVHLAGGSDQSDTRVLLPLNVTPPQNPGYDDELAKVQGPWQRCLLWIEGTAEPVALGREEDACLGCLTNKKTVVFKECLHVCYCVDCARNSQCTLDADPLRCPACRRLNTAAASIFR